MSCRLNNSLTDSSSDAVKVICDMVREHLGVTGSVRCIVAGDGESEVYVKDTAETLKYLDIQHPAALYVVQTCEAHKDLYGCGVKSLLFLVGQLCAQVHSLLQQGIPLPFIEQLLDEAVEDCIAQLHSVTAPVTLCPSPGHLQGHLGHLDHQGHFQGLQGHKGHIQGHLQGHLQPHHGHLQGHLGHLLESQGQRQSHGHLEGHPLGHLQGHEGPPGRVQGNQGQLHSHQHHPPQGCQGHGQGQAGHLQGDGQGHDSHSRTPRTVCGSSDLHRGRPGGHPASPSAQEQSALRHQHGSDIGAHSRRCELLTAGAPGPRKNSQQRTSLHSQLASPGPWNKSCLVENSKRLVRGRSKPGEAGSGQIGITDSSVSAAAGRYRNIVLRSRHLQQCELPDEVEEECSPTQRDVNSSCALGQRPDLINNLQHGIDSVTFQTNIPVCASSRPDQFSTSHEDPGSSVRNGFKNLTVSKRAAHRQDSSAARKSAVCLPMEGEALSHGCHEMMLWAQHVMNQHLLYGGKASGLVRVQNSGVSFSSGCVT